MMQTAPFRFSFLIFFMMMCSLLSFTACGGTDDGQYSDERFNVNEVSFDQPELLLQIEESDDLFFTRISGFTQDKSGNLFVIDSGSSEIHKYDRDANHMQTIGRQGRGPGEFEQLGYIRFDEKNRMFALDYGSFNLSIFSQNSSGNWEFEHSFSIFQWGAAGSPRRIPTIFDVIDNDRIAVQYSYYMGMPGSDEDTPEPLLVSLFDYDGNQHETFRLQAEKEDLIEGRVRGNETFLINPFGGTNLNKVTRDGTLYHNWSLNSQIAIYSLHDPVFEDDEAAADEKLLRSNATIDVPIESVPVTSADVREFLELVEAEISGEARRSISETKPHFSAFIPSDDELLWAQLYHPSTTRLQNPSRFVAINPENGRAEQFIGFERFTQISAIQNGKIYGISYDDDSGMFYAEVYELPG
ncbi:MAG: 6-bladed beta-propeller [Balneolales bacterium]|nr:6-bladed beta-propeller [Balneolales bacterium]